MTSVTSQRAHRPAPDLKRQTQDSCTNRVPSPNRIAGQRWVWFVVGVITCGLPLHCHAIVTGTRDVTTGKTASELSVVETIQERSTEAAVLQSGLEAFPRIEQASKMRATFDAIIETESERIALREKMKQQLAAAVHVPVNQASTAANDTAANSSERSRESKPTTPVAAHPFAMPSDVKLPGEEHHGSMLAEDAPEVPPATTTMNPGTPVAGSSPVASDTAESHHAPEISLVSSSSAQASPPQTSRSAATVRPTPATRPQADWGSSLLSAKPTINPFFVAEDSTDGHPDRPTAPTASDAAQRYPRHQSDVSSGPASYRSNGQISAASMITNRVSQPAPKPVGPQPIVINKRMPAQTVGSSASDSAGVVKAIAEISPSTSNRPDAAPHAFALPPMEPQLDPEATTTSQPNTAQLVATRKHTSSRDETDDWTDLLLTGAGQHHRNAALWAEGKADFPPLKRPHLRSSPMIEQEEIDPSRSTVSAEHAPPVAPVEIESVPPGKTPSPRLDSDARVAAGAVKDIAESVPAILPPAASTVPEPMQPEYSQPASPRSTEAEISLVPVNASDTPSDVTLNVNEVDVRVVLEMLAKGYGLNLLIAPGVDGTVTANVSGLSPEKTLQGLVRMCGLAMQRDGDLILIYPKENLPLDARQVRVFRLDFARSGTVDPTVQTLLSPVGTAYASKVDETDNRQGCEAMVVIDVPEVIDQVERYLIEADQAPRQVLIEARVLEIELTDGMRHGVNLRHFNGGAHHGTFRTSDNGAMSANPFFFTDVNGQDLSTWLALMQQTADAKTLATPQVMAVNGQTAKIQVGQQLGYSVATVTETSTIQDVRYLETGIVLQVTPTISRDDRVLLQVKPKVSSGEINPETRLPEETTREIETSVMLNNHQGMIIGGLIQEQDRVAIRKTPILGDVKHIGPLFQRRESRRSRSEIIVALIPHIIEPGQAEHCEFPVDANRVDDWEQAGTPLFNGPLNRNCRPWEAKLPDAASQGAAAKAIERMRNADPYR
ncbi:type II secretion system protein GspD [Roseiconus lacunae]|uniref:Type II/III secretion system secretin-like domain-containing protein n=1 Tax=Roseiconus lacunae TaxID=2605694 RepID=A0ABT7PRI5_9BACT|nr:hypothetical protein [Roseiconus lacunae]MDM4018721.1 hypothetical protein [Roseiconus lacunae]